MHRCLHRRCFAAETCMLIHAHLIPVQKIMMKAMKPMLKMTRDLLSQSATVSSMVASDERGDDLDPNARTSLAMGFCSRSRETTSLKCRVCRSLYCLRN
jgi:hypothetical protein